jgi:hypothetical protein
MNLLPPYSGRRMVLVTSVCNNREIRPVNANVGNDSVGTKFCIPFHSTKD